MSAAGEKQPVNSKRQLNSMEEMTPAGLLRSMLNIYNAAKDKLLTLIHLDLGKYDYHLGYPKEAYVHQPSPLAAFWKQNGTKAMVNNTCGTGLLAYPAVHPVLYNNYIRLGDISKLTVRSLVHCCCMNEGYAHPVHSGINHCSTLLLAPPD
ncbi:hypothetical protein Baya_5030 [Bagarius yarrelli]|uniref:Uncharacterized protein n=1 Tax=Bagarius yarrelli TaxID=175774 RepID=A0A556TVB0_BAGYA|nr:hypothetical protein Baya_5030 [Bagarius yarrelli]